MQKGLTINFNYPSMSGGRKGTRNTADENVDENGGGNDLLGGPSQKKLRRPEVEVVGYIKFILNRNFWIL